MRLSPWILVLGAALAACAGQMAGAAATVLTSCAHQDHLWFVLESGQKTKRGFDLCHHATDLGGPFFKPQCWLAQEPEAMASWENRVWIVFPSKTGATVPHRGVFTLEVRKNAAFNMYVSNPANRLEIAPSLPAEGELVSFIGTRHGPVAVLMPTPNELQDSGGAKPRALQLSDGQWTEIELPAAIDARGRAVACAGGFDGSQLIVFGEDGGQCVRHVRQSNDSWMSEPYPLDLSRLRSITSVGSHLAAVMSDRASSTVDAVYLRSEVPVPLMTIERPDGAWSIVGLRDGLRVLEHSPSKSLQIREVRPLSGAVLASQSMTVQPLATGKLWQISMLVAASIAALLLVFLIKPVTKAPVALPSGVGPMPIGARLIALCIDLLPAGVVAGLLLQAQMKELLAVPVFTIDLQQSVPYLLMAALTIVHSTISELVHSTTLGKALLGGRVTTVDGSRPKPRQILLRNALKCVILLVPPLAVFAFINPHMQGLADMAAGMLVVREAPDAAENQNQDR